MHRYKTTWQCDRCHTKHVDTSDVTPRQSLPDLWLRLDLSTAIDTDFSQVHLCTDCATRFGEKYIVK